MVVVVVVVWSRLFEISSHFSNLYFFYNYFSFTRVCISGSLGNLNDVGLGYMR